MLLRWKYRFFSQLVFICLSTKNESLNHTIDPEMQDTSSESSYVHLVERTFSRIGFLFQIVSEKCVNATVTFIVFMEHTSATHCWHTQSRQAQWRADKSYPRVHDTSDLKESAALWCLTCGLFKMSETHAPTKTLQSSWDSKIYCFKVQKLQRSPDLRERNI